MNAAGFEDRLSDGMTLAIGGLGLQRKPMSLIRRVVDSGVTDLRVVTYLGSVDVEFLIAAGVVAEVHSAGVGMDGFGLAPAFRRARQTGSIRFVEWSEGSLMSALEAGARGLPSMPTPTDPRSDVVHGEWLRVAPDPFTNQEIVIARALEPDVAVVHAAGVDDQRNLYCHGDLGVDGLMVRAAATSVASASVAVAFDAPGVAISGVWIDDVVVDPTATWPTGCEPDVLIDLATMSTWAAGTGDDVTGLVP